MWLGEGMHEQLCCHLARESKGEGEGSERGTAREKDRVLEE